MTVDRTYEFAEPDNEVVVIFDDGYTTVRFWVTGLSDDEYIRRAKEIQKLEKR